MDILVSLNHGYIFSSINLNLFYKLSASFLIYLARSAIFYYFFSILSISYKINRFFIDIY